MWSRRTRFWMFGAYSHLTRLRDLALDALPPPARNACLRLMLGSLGRDSMIDYGVYFRYPEQVHIGDNVAVNRNCSFYASHHHRDVRIVLRDNVTISPQVVFFAAGHDHARLDLPDTAASIEVGEYAWVGGRAIILPGVTIGEGAVVGAGSVVTADVPPRAVVAGNPARVVKQRQIDDR